MQRLPTIPVEKIPPTVKVSKGTDLKQYLAAQGEFWTEQVQVWVRETAEAAHAEIVRAGNPRYNLTQVDGKLSGSRRYIGGRPGTIAQAHKSVRVSYQANELAMVANGLRPILSDVIRKRYPNSQLNRLARDWVWWAVRRSRENDTANRSHAEYLGGTINVPIGIYDTLWLVPDSPKPAEYAWFANNLAKRKHTGAVRRQRRDAKPTTMRDRRFQGYLGEAVKRMRGKKVAGVVIWGMFISRGLTAAFARNQKGLIPVVGVAFNQRLQQAVS